MKKTVIERILAGPVRTNCYLLYNEETRVCLIFDPADEADKIKRRITELELKPCAILLTHGHFDHIHAADELRKEYSVSVFCHAEEKEIMESAGLNLSEMFGAPFTVTPDISCLDGEELSLAEWKLRVLHTPGHTKGSCCYYIEDERILISGDTLFEESVGRTDFPTGSGAVLARSIREKLYTLPAETCVYPGHEGTTTIEHEKAHNRCV